MKPHKHADLIHAWADAAEIERPEPNLDFVHKTRIVQFKNYSAIQFEVGPENISLTFDGETGELKKAEVL